MDPIPPLTQRVDLPEQLTRAGWAVVEPTVLGELTTCDPRALASLGVHWDDLPRDPHLRDGGSYRRRRHGCFRVRDGHVVAVPPRPHWQPLEYNALHGGIERWFAPLDPAMVSAPAFEGLLVGLAGVADGLRGSTGSTAEWAVEVHPFRIDTGPGGTIGRPTPEGAHRDGVDLVVVVVVDRRNVKGGETRVFEAHGPSGVRFTLDEPWTALLLDDERVIHETTPIQPLDPEAVAWRDTLVLTFRRGDFQGPR